MLRKLKCDVCHEAGTHAVYDDRGLVMGYYCERHGLMRHRDLERSMSLIRAVGKPDRYRT